MGSEITSLALALFAAVTLRASPLEMGLLVAATQLPFLLFSLPAGVWVDRRRRRPILIATDVGSALLLLSVPLAVPFGGPGFVHLWLVAFGTGTMAVISEVAHYAYVPAVVGHERLVEANSRLQVSYSVTGAAGPGVAGLLVQVVSAPVAVVADAASFLVSAALLRSIRKPEAAPLRPGGGGRLLGSIVGGMRMLLGHPLLRPIIVASVPLSFFGSAFLAVYVLYATRELGLGPAVIGLVFAGGGVGAVIGAVLSRRTADRFGVGPTIISGWLLAAAAVLAVPFAAGPPALVIAVLLLAKGFEGVAATVANIHQWTLRQVVTPDHLAGRVTAGHRFMVYGAGAIGAVIGGALGEAVGLRTTLLVCGIGGLLSPLLILGSPLRRLRTSPSPAPGRRTA